MRLIHGQFLSIVGALKGYFIAAEYDQMKKGGRTYRYKEITKLKANANSKDRKDATIVIVIFQIYIIVNKQPKIT